LSSPIQSLAKCCAIVTRARSIVGGKGSTQSSFRCGASMTDAVCRAKKIQQGRNVMHSSAELVKALAGIIGALAFFVVLIHQITRMLG
jgi:hypothetical protein